MNVPGTQGGGGVADVVGEQYDTDVVEIDVDTVVLHDVRVLKEVDI